MVVAVSATAIRATSRYWRLMPGIIRATAFACSRAPGHGDTEGLSGGIPGYEPQRHREHRDRQNLNVPCFRVAWFHVRVRSSVPGAGFDIQRFEVPRHRLVPRTSTPS